MDLQLLKDRYNTFAEKIYLEPVLLKNWIKRVTWKTHGLLIDQEERFLSPPPYKGSGRGREDMESWNWEKITLFPK